VLGEKASWVDEIESLGLRYGIVTPYTTDVIHAQMSGFASQAIMGLYNQDLDGDGILDINKVSGEATIGVRVQNQMYQQAMQSNQASGSNVINIGEKNVAQLGYYALDMELFVGRGLDITLLDGHWFDGNVERVVQFGSDEYFELAKNSTANQIMQAGPNVIFEFEGKIIAVQEGASNVNLAPVQQETGILDWLLSMLEWLFD
jgi:hypothetical protein